MLQRCPVHTNPLVKAVTPPLKARCSDLIAPVMPPRLPVAKRRPTSVSAGQSRLVGLAGLEPAASSLLSKGKRSAKRGFPGRARASSAKLGVRSDLVPSGTGRHYRPRDLHHCPAPPHPWAPTRVRRLWNWRACMLKCRGSSKRSNGRVNDRGRPRARVRATNRVLSPGPAADESPRSRPHTPGAGDQTAAQRCGRRATGRPTAAPGSGSAPGRPRSSSCDRRASSSGAGPPPDAATGP